MNNLYNKYLKMDINCFIKFTQETLNRSITQTDIIKAKNDPNNKTNADIVEINNLLYIWKDLPLRGKNFFIDEANRLTLEEEQRYHNTIIPSYQEYVDRVEKRIIEINKEYAEDKDDGNEDIEEYTECILSKTEYEALSFEEYSRLLHFKKFRKISPYIHFTKTYRQAIRNEDSLISNQQRSLRSMGEKLGLIWQELPNKGKLDY